MNPDPWHLRLEIINATELFLLVLITLHYARSTAALVRESCAQRDMLQRQAIAAENTLSYLEGQRRDEVARAKLFVRTELFRIDSLLRQMHSQETGAAFHPGDAPLLPLNMQDVLGHARLLSQEGADALAEALGAVAAVEAQVRVIIQLKSEDPDTVEPGRYDKAITKYDRLYEAAIERLSWACNFAALVA